MRHRGGSAAGSARDGPRIEVQVVRSVVVFLLLLGYFTTNAWGRPDPASVVVSPELRQTLAGLEVGEAVRISFHNGDRCEAVVREVDERTMTVRLRHGVRRAIFEEGATLRYDLELIASIEPSTNDATREPRPRERVVAGLAAVVCPSIWLSIF